MAGRPVRECTASGLDSVGCRAGSRLAGTGLPFCGYLNVVRRATDGNAPCREMLLGTEILSSGAPCPATLLVRRRSSPASRNRLWPNGSRGCLSLRLAVDEAACNVTTGSTKARSGRPHKQPEPPTACQIGSLGRGRERHGPARFVHSGPAPCVPSAWKANKPPARRGRAAFLTGHSRRGSPVPPASRGGRTRFARQTTRNRIRG